MIYIFDGASVENTVLKDSKSLISTDIKLISILWNKIIFFSPMEAYQKRKFCSLELPSL